MKLQEVINQESDRRQLLHLQQLFIEDLPDNYEVDLTEFEHLGNCVRITYQRNEYGKPTVKIRYYRPTLGEAVSRDGRIDMATHQNTYWSSLLYRSLLNLLNA